MLAVGRNPAIILLAILAKFMVIIPGVAKQLANFGSI